MKAEQKTYFSKQYSVTDKARAKEIVDNLLKLKSDEDRQQAIQILAGRIRLKHKVKRYKHD